MGMFRVREPSPEGILVFSGTSALFLTLAVFWATLLPPAVLPPLLPTIFMGITLEEPPLPASVGGGGEMTAFFGVGLSAGGIFSDSFAFVVGDELIHNGLVCFADFAAAHDEVQLFCMAVGEGRAGNAGQERGAKSQFGKVHCSLPRLHFGYSLTAPAVRPATRYF